VRCAAAPRGYVVAACATAAHPLLDLPLLGRRDYADFAQGRARLTQLDQLLAKLDASVGCGSSPVFSYHDRSDSHLVMALSSYVAGHLVCVNCVAVSARRRALLRRPKAVNVRRSPIATQWVRGCGAVRTGTIRVPTQRLRDTCSMVGGIGWKDRQLQAPLHTFSTSDGAEELDALVKRTRRQSATSETGQCTDTSGQH